MSHFRSLLNNANPRVRETYLPHLWMFILGAPFNAMIAYAPFLAVKTFNARAWAPALTAIIPAAHLLAVFFTSAISRSSKTAWVVRPMIFSNLIFMLLIGVDHSMGSLFSLVIIMALLLRAPIISAQSAIFRTNYPPEIRSYALAVPMAWQMGTNALFAWGAGKMFDRSEWWVIPYFLVAAFTGIVGALAFRKVPSDDNVPRTVVVTGSRTWIEHGSEYFRQTVFQFRSLMGKPSFLRYQIAYMFFGSGSVAITAIMPFYLAEEFGANHEQGTSAINVVPMLTTALTLPLWGWILDRSNPLVMRSVTTGIWMFTPLMLYFASSIEGVYWAQLIQGGVVSGSTLIWWLGVNYFAKSHEVAHLMSIHQTLTGVRGIIMPFLGIGIAHWIGYRQSMLFWFVLMVIGFAMMVDEVRREMKLGKLRSFSETEAGMAQMPAGLVEEPENII